jgi:hypothetical protein
MKRLWSNNAPSSRPGPREAVERIRKCNLSLLVQIDDAGDAFAAYTALSENCQDSAMFDVDDGFACHCGGQERHSRRLSGRVAAILCYRRYIGPLQPISSISGYRREQLFAFGMLCTDRKRGRFSSGLGLASNRCSHKFCAVTADVRTRTFHRGPCDPHSKCHARRDTG